MINLLKQQITVKNKSTANTTGRQVPTYSALYSLLPASIQPAKSQRQNYYQARGITISNEIYVGKALTLTVGCIVVYGSRQFYVTGWRNLQERGQVFVMDCRELTGTELIIQE